MSNKLINTAIWLSIITIVYNVLEGLISIWYGMEDETLALLGFGVDSFVEVISGIGILHLVIRMKKSAIEKRDQFERYQKLISDWEKRYDEYLKTIKN